MIPTLRSRSSARDRTALQQFLRTLKTTTASTIDLDGALAPLGLAVNTDVEAILAIAQTKILARH